MVSRGHKICGHHVAVATKWPQNFKEKCRGGVPAGCIVRLYHNEITHVVLVGRKGLGCRIAYRTDFMISSCRRHRRLLNHVVFVFLQEQRVLLEEEELLVTMTTWQEESPPVERTVW
jgi:hypothetical protein